jgi:hypothetical protein
VLEISKEPAEINAELASIMRVVTLYFGPKKKLLMI